MFEIEFEPISDEELYGEKPEFEAAFYWPFGTLLANFYKLAKRNGIDWPLRSRYDWQSLEKVKAAMEFVFKRLPACDKDFIKSDYNWFLDKSKIIDWKGVVEYKEPTINVSGSRILDELGREEK
ncbi:MAG: hypothetical protein PHY02_09680 [Phycisphaerae bacterium]|nr:hypothetical protein [Phycisphaerae bacterium]